MMTTIDVNKSIKSLKNLDRKGSVINEEQYLKRLAGADFWTLFWITDPYVHRVQNDTFREYNLNFLQKVYVVLEFPESCTLATIIASFHIILIIFNVASVIASSVPNQQYIPDTCLSPVCNNDSDLCPGRMICAPRTAPYLGYIDGACGAFFAAHLLIRLCLNPLMPPRLSGAVSLHWDDCEKLTASKENRPAVTDPEYTQAQQFLKYVFSIHFCIDISTTVLALLVASNSNGLHDDVFIRAFETARLMLIMRFNTNGRLVADMINRTMYFSQEAHSVLFFYFGLLVLFFSALVYVVEEGEFTINEDFPNGAFLRPNGFGGLSVSNFDSLPSVIYFVIVSICTVGYGDMSPTTAWGRLFTCLIALCGVVVTSLPISVISSAFTEQYQNYLKRKVRLDNIRNIIHKRKVALVMTNFRTENAATAAAIIAKCANGKCKSGCATESNVLQFGHSYRAVESDETYYKRTASSKDVEIELSTKIGNDELKLSVTESLTDISHLSDKSSHNDDPSDYVVPMNIHQILAITDEAIENLTQEEMKVLIWEIIIAYKKQIEKNRAISEMLADMERTALKIAAKIARGVPQILE